jgi:hypothetical protein
MKRLVINVNVISVLYGLILYCGLQVFFAFQEHLPPLKGSLFATAMGCMWLAMTPLGLVVSLVRLLPERRLRAGFTLVDLYPTHSGYRRTFTLRTSGANVLHEVRLLLAESLVVQDHTSAADNTRASYRVRFGEAVDYEIALDVSADSCTVSISVRRLGLFPQLATNEVGAAQLLAGVAKWMADHGLVTADFAPYSQPQRLDRDLGRWLPQSDEWRDNPPTLEDAAVFRRARERSYRKRILIGGVLGLSAFAALAYFDTHVRPLPRLVTGLPLLIVASYMLRQAIVRVSPRRRRG